MREEAFQDRCQQEYACARAALLELDRDVQTAAQCAHRRIRRPCGAAPRLDAEHAVDQRLGLGRIAKIVEPEDLTQRFGAAFLVDEDALVPGRILFV